MSSRAIIQIDTKPIPLKEIAARGAWANEPIPRRCGRSTRPASARANATTFSKPQAGTGASRSQDQIGRLPRRPFRYFDNVAALTRKSLTSLPNLHGLKGENSPVHTEGVTGSNPVPPTRNPR